MKIESGNTRGNYKRRRRLDLECVYVLKIDVFISCVLSVLFLEL